VIRKEESETFRIDVEKKSRTKSFRKRLCGQLKATTDDTTELLDADVLALDLGAGLVLLVGRHTDEGAINLPAADIDDELVERVTAADIEPGLEVLGGDGAEGVSDLNGDANADEFLEAGNIGGQVGIQIVRVQGGPELGVLGGLEEGGQTGELLNGLDKVGGLRGGLGFGGGRERLSACWEQGEAEREGGRGEYGQGLGQDVGDGVGLDEVGVELEAGFF
jgi:hypothetical protein